MEKIVIAQYNFDQLFESYKEYVRQNYPNKVFSTNSFEAVENRYKHNIYDEARIRLSAEQWQESDIGSGKIIDNTIAAIEIKGSKDQLGNNLVEWDNRRGENNRLHQPLYDAKKSNNQLSVVETCLYNLYNNNDGRNKQSFEDLIAIFGKQYPLIAYLFFIKDKSKFLPIRTTYFDSTFALLDVDFKTTRKCSWENYQQFIELIEQLRILLSDRFEEKVELLDAHSFAWIISSNVRPSAPKDKKHDQLHTDFENHLPTEAKATHNIRIGQSEFREKLLRIWSKCAVTGCSEAELLIASHIKPWAHCGDDERLDIYNGLLLSPNIDSCFDKGYISFDDDGKILISKKLSQENAEILGIQRQMKLSQIDESHRKYLAYHRSNIFQQ